MTESAQPGDGLRCLFLGDQLLAVECASTARTAGLSVAAVLSNDARTLELASARGFKTHSDVEPSEVAGLLRDHRADVLVTVAYERVLPDEAIGAARFAINFHDGPLPLYGGLNAPTWAIHQDAAWYGVTWHLITTQVDRGDIVVEETFPIRPDETAFSLNARCYQAGIDTFGLVARALVEGELPARAQPDGPRQMFRRRDRPTLVISADSSAAEVERTSRALDVGPRLANRVGVARWLLGDGPDWLIPTSVRRGEGAGDGLAGQIQDVSAAGVTIQVRDATLVLADLVTPAGAKVDMDRLVEAGLVRVGGQIPQRAAELGALLARHDAELASDEPWWIARLEESTVEPLALLEPAAGAEWAVLPVRGVADADRAVLAGAVAAWLCGVTNAQHALIECTDASVRNRYAELAPFLQPPIVGLSARPDELVVEVRDRAAADVAGALSHGPFLQDLVARLPGHRGHPVDPQVALDLDVTDMDLLPERGSIRIALQPDGNLALHHRLSPQRAELIAAQLAGLVEAVRADPQGPVGALSLLGAGDRALLERINTTASPLDPVDTIDAQFRRQVAATPTAPAVSSGGVTLQYAELAARSEVIAAALAGAGVGRGDTVGVALPRGVEMLATILGVLRLGAAYLPLDPDYPRDRVQFMLADSGAGVVVADESDFGGSFARTVSPPAQALAASGDVDEPSHGGEDLAYVIYTSGSTGRPKGVEIEHRNVVNFFTAMDRVVPVDSSTVWLAVTSISFDIAVLELLWTLTRGCHVVIRPQSGFGMPEAQRPAMRTPSFSIAHFAAGSEISDRGYRPLLEIAKWADRNGIEAIWLPERHFHDFGGPFPNPSVVAAAIAVCTERVGIRAGSVVLPLHSPMRVAEEWAVVDRLSGGRVGLGVAAGWQPRDFVLNPSAYGRSNEELADRIDDVRRLWRGDPFSAPGPDGELVELTTMPRPVTAELPVWITSAGSPATYERAGRLGYNLFTHLLGQSVDQLAEKLRLYRQARRDAGHAGAGHVTVMLHTYIGDDSDEAKGTARGPLKNYLGTAASLIKDMASAFPTLRGAGADADEAFRSLTDDEVSQLLDMATERYLTRSGLVGSVDDVLPVAEAVAAAGVDEFACLVDFGVDVERVAAGLDHLLELRQRLEASCASSTVASPETDAENGDLAFLVERYGVTHLQCTPSFASIALADPAVRRAVATLDHLLVGGEALPQSLAADLRRLVKGRITNMYGPTETTIWSLTHELVGDVQGAVPIGVPVANTTVHILDGAGRTMPPGAAGELYLGGEGVARGYHDRPQLTDERFVDRPGLGRLYATGDIARVNEAGLVEFLGRRDQQVKIRGHRIEIGEIESLLERHPGVSRGVVVVRAGDLPELVAHVVPANGAIPDEATLRRHLAAALPEAMIPSRVEVVSELPHTPNGKVDRVALAAAAPSSRGIVVASPPRTDVEGAVARIWQGALDRPVGLDDNFFDIGGHSLLAVKVHRQLTEEFGERVALTDVFRFPTVRTMATHLGETLPEGEGVVDGETPTVDTEPTGLSRGERRRRARSLENTPP